MLAFIIIDMFRVGIESGQPNHKATKAIFYFFLQTTKSNVL